MTVQQQTVWRRNPLFLPLKSVRDWVTLRQWLRHRSPPPPYVFKRRTIKEYARRYGLEVFIETGTYLGDTTAAMKGLFSRLYSIELDATLHAAAVKRFERDSHVRLLQGDSGERIVEILKELKERALFWLDGHYSGGFTAKAALETPILQELSHIFAHSIRDHVILIDDARCFGVDPDYPSIEQLKTFVLGHRPDAEIEVADDIIRIMPPVVAK
jgi:hypothetical protein